MPPKKVAKESIEIRFLGFVFKSINPSYKSLIALGIALIGLVAVWVIFFFQLKKENPLSWGYKQFFEQTKIRAPQKKGSD